MSSSDDFTDRQLREHFQDVFAGFEKQPSAETKKRIWQRLPKSTSTYRRYGVLSIGLLLLIGTVLYLQLYRPVTKFKPSQLQSPQTLAGGQHNPIPIQLEKVIPAGKLAPSSRTLTDVSRQINPITRSIIGAKSARVTNLASGQKSRQPGKRLPKVGKRRHPGQLTFRDTPPAPTRFTPLGRNDLEEAVQLAVSSNAVLAETSAISQSTSTNQPARPAEPAEREIDSWPLVRSLSLHPDRGLQAQINRTVKLTLSTSLPVDQSNSPKRPLRWFATVAPLSTYQWMTVVANPETYVQRVDAPAAFSGPTWGYQLRGGLEWRTADVHLSVGQIRRWAYYDLATSTFQVKPTGVNQYQVTRLEQPIAENVSLLMLGAGLSKQYMLGGPHSPYFARLGGSATYVPDVHQSLIWINASLGLSLPLAKFYQLQVGPTAEYGVSRLWSTGRQLSIHPYLVGAVLAIQPGKP